MEDNVVVSVRVIVASDTSGAVKSTIDNSPETTSSMPGMALIELMISITRLPVNAVVRAETAAAAAGDTLPTAAGMMTLVSLEGMAIV